MLHTDINIFKVRLEQEVNCHLTYVFVERELQPDIEYEEVEYFMSEDNSLYLETDESECCLDLYDSDEFKAYLVNSIADSRKQQRCDLPRFSIQFDFDLISQ